MFCKNCGTYNEDGSTVCIQCGTQLAPPVNQPVYAPDNNNAPPFNNAAYVPGSNMPPAKKNPAPIIAAVLGVFLVAAIAIIAVLLFRANKPVSPSEITSATAASSAASNASTTAGSSNINAAAATDPADDPNYDPGCPALQDGEIPIQAEEGASPSPYYGIFCSAYKNYDDANKNAEKLRQQGFSNAQVVYTTDWSNLNTEPWYCVIAGAYTTKAAADEALPKVKAVYGDAYVKYSGDYQAD